ncbi:P1 family peptidase [Nocardioides lentus]|uniref:P1 family peptidase n=1 Tax=Nocardioides lentus TaxID=338077 RepID=A0ABP5A7Y4_9ACTN
MSGQGASGPGASSLGVAGVGVGHWTDTVAATGCTVVVLPEGTVASCEVRGGAPASRETDVLDPSRTVARVDAVLLTGGSAFGLAAADGVMRWCEERGRGVPTPAGPVPIVPALGIFDLAVGSASVRPGPAEGYAACADATTDGRLTGRLTGRLGAGTGAMRSQHRGPAGRRPGGLGHHVVRREVGGVAVSVAALVVVNAFGDVDPGDPDLPGRVLDDLAAAAPPPGGPGSEGGREHTTIGVVVTDAVLDKTGCRVLAQGAHDGLSRALTPPHTRLDGDGFVACATGGAAGSAAVPVDVLRLMALDAVTRAVRSVAREPGDAAPAHSS